MGYAPDAPLPGACGELPERDGLRHQRIGEAPKKCGDGEIAGNHHDAVGERDLGEAGEGINLGERGEEMRPRPRPPGDQKPQREEKNPGDRGGPGAKLAAARIGRGREQQPLGEMAQHLAASGIDRLDKEGVERPETRFGETEERPPTEPADRHGCQEHNHGPKAKLGRGDIVGDRPEPHGRGDRHETEQDSGNDEEETPGDDELGQADLDQHAASKRKHRALLGARSVVLDVALARVDDRLHRHLKSLSNSSARTPLVRAISANGVLPAISASVTMIWPILVASCAIEAP